MNKEKEVEAYLKGVLPEEQKLKYEIAQELGILDKVLNQRTHIKFLETNVRMSEKL